jgi:hypothetical protein
MLPILKDDGGFFFLFLFVKREEKERKENLLHIPPNESQLGVAGASLST